MFRLLFYCLFVPEKKEERNIIRGVKRNKGKEKEEGVGTVRGGKGGVGTTHKEKWKEEEEGNLKLWKI